MKPRRLLCLFDLLLTLVLGRLLHAAEPSPGALSGGEARTLLRTLLAVAGRDHSGRVRNDPAKRRRTRKG